MAIQSVKSIFIGVIATIVGGLILLWWVDLLPLQRVGDFTTDFKGRSHTFSFYSPQIKIYEGQNTMIEQSQRVYKDTLNSESATFIFWELTVNHPELGSDTPVNMLVVYKNGSGEELTRMNYEAVSKKGWAASMYTWGWGSETPGYWKNGNYTIELYYSGNLIASKPFFIL